MAEILSHVCIERDGEVRRVVVEMPRKISLWLDIVEKMETVPNFLQKNSYENTRAFLDDRNRFFLIDNVGIAAAIPQRWFETAHVHITFWDRKLRGREELCRRLVEYVIETMELDHAITVIPRKSEAVLAFAKRIGFKDKSEDSEFRYLVY